MLKMLKMLKMREKREKREMREIVKDLLVHRLRQICVWFGRGLARKCPRLG